MLANRLDASRVMLGSGGITAKQEAQMLAKLTSGRPWSSTTRFELSSASTFSARHLSPSGSSGWASGMCSRSHAANSSSDIGLSIARTTLKSIQRL